MSHTRSYWLHKAVLTGKTPPPTRLGRTFGHFHFDNAAQTIFKTEVICNWQRTV